jgi:glycosyltransferase involved in cell wall biosynthesis
MKIVHLTWGLGVGGAESMLVDIANEQAVAHDVWVIVGNRDIDASVARGFDTSIRMATVGRPPGSANPWYFLKLMGRLWRINPDVIHTHQDSFARCKKLVSAPMVLTVHNTRLPLSHGLAAFDSVLCISKAVQNDVISRFPRCPARIISNGIKFRAASLKSAYGFRPFRIVQISRLAHEQKGQDVLIRSLPQVLERLGQDSVSVDFIGEGASLDYLVRLSEECGVKAQCRFLGAIARQSIYERLCEYDLLIQPSRYEGFGLSILEGIAAGLPVLVSDVEGPMEIIAGGRFGWSFRSEDPQDLSAKVIELVALSRNPDFGNRMRDRAEQSRSLFDVKLTARKYVEEYSRLIAETGALGSRA